MYGEIPKKEVIFPMKRLLGLIMFLLIIYVIYYDLSRGTLPIATETSIQVEEEHRPYEQEEAPRLAFFEKEVQSGETVLSIIETQLDTSIPVSIQQVVLDFEELNGDTKADAIHIGKTYKFPDYRKLTE